MSKNIIIQASQTKDFRDALISAVNTLTNEQAQAFSDALNGYLKIATSEEAINGSGNNLMTPPLTLQSIQANAATKAQGAKADTAIQANMLGSAAYSDNDDFVPPFDAAFTNRPTVNGVGVALQSELSSSSYKGTWDADTNIPEVLAGEGTNGEYYVVNVAGTQSITGSPIYYLIGDQIRFNGSAWERVPKFDAVNSVAGKTGTVTLTASDISGVATAAQGTKADSALQPSTGVFRIDLFSNASSVNIPNVVKRVYIEDRGAHFKEVVSEPSHALKFVNAGRWFELDEKILKPNMFAILGDGTNEQTKLQTLLDFAIEKEILWDYGKTYGYNFLTVPNNVKFSGFGFTFRRLSSNISAGFRVNNWLYAEYLKFSSPGGSSGDKCVRFQGSNNYIEYLHIEADAEGNGTAANYAIEMESNPSGTYLSRNVINSIYCKNYSTCATGSKLTFIEINNIVVEKYRTAFYFKDTNNSVFKKARIKGLGAAVNGAAGENGLLLESTVPNATSNIIFEDWIVEDSGEHAYRLGGQQTIKNIWFEHCKSYRSGSSILSGNLSSGEWHGGCGFKVLGGASENGTRHKNIYFNQCHVYDVNQTFGSYPAGHGVNNFTPFLLVLVDGVYLNECVIDGEELDNSCRYGLLTSCSNGVYVNNCDFRKCQVAAIRPYEENLFEGYPGYNSPLENFHIRGGKFEVNTTASNSGIVYLMDTVAAQAHKNWSVRDAEFRGGASGINIVAPSTGSFTNCNADFTYNTPTSVIDSSTTFPVAGGAGLTNWLLNLRTPDRPSAVNFGPANGSTHTRVTSGKIFDYISSLWVERVSAVITSTGGYTPTSTIVSNLDVATTSFTNYSRVGNVVTVFGRIDFDPTATGTIQARITLPIFSDITAGRQVGGTFNSWDGTIHGQIVGDATNDQLLFVGIASTTSIRTCSFTANYVIV